ncbi:VOC family protein [Colwellia psychrerythraea]|uniref:Glyoxalase-like domain containing protein n=1 Tax=Colwellia psychrerythraea TaxID=28229 RepID=A0A099KMR1_COLPS|nr:VOC family protein [Colwellia psychrerythraea]KGJ90948.1 Glyoxalase-like domain containing protein [Colwellia psychrerythraea]
MEQITRVNHLGIRVFSLETSRSFYEQLGFKFLVGPVGPEPVAIMEHASGVNINFILNAAAPTDSNVLMDEPVKKAGYTHVALEVNDMDAVVAKLNELNIEITEGPVVFPTGSSTFIRDPDRNVIEFHQPKS